ncbi:RAB guanine nucleotide exchange factor (GEF) 1 [Cricetulus griseus]
MQTRGKVPPEKVEKIMDQIEKHIMTRLYKFVFCPETTDDEKKDLAIQKRIRRETNCLKAVDVISPPPPCWVEFSRQPCRHIFASLNW